MAHESHEEVKEEPIGRNTIYETMKIGPNIQTIKLLDTDNIVGITLVSGANDLHSGRISATLIFGSLRQDFNITLFGLDNRLAQRVATIVKVTDDGIAITGFNPIWSHTDDEGKNGISLESMVIMRSIPTYAEAYKTSDEPEWHKRWDKDRRDREDKEGKGDKDRADESSDYWLDKYRGG